MNLPKARTADIVEQDAGAELLIYNTQTNKTYLLNETSKNVFSACAKGLALSELKRRFHYSDDLIHFALAELRANGLIESETSNHFQGLTRREVIKRVGLGSLAALPAIAALTAPTAANAASVCPDPSGSNIPSGCPVGSSLSASGADCSAATNVNRDNDCDIAYDFRCEFGRAAYAANTCTVVGNDTQFSCVCG